MALREIMSRVHRFMPRQSDDDYVVDIAFRSWDQRSQPEFTGVHAAMVGRKQRRFIVWHSVPAASIRLTPSERGSSRCYPTQHVS